MRILGHSQHVRQGTAAALDSVPLIPARRAPESRKAANPYVGPGPFGRDDAYHFFGRAHETAELYSLVVAHRTVLLYAPSGAGKTSLLNARLIPMLEKGGYEVLATLRISQLRATRQPRSDNRGLHIAKPAPQTNVFVDAFAGVLNRPRRVGANSELVPRVLVFDQFEEFFTSYPERWQERRGFFEELDNAMTADPTLRALFAMREDFVAEIEPYEDLLPEEFHTRYRLERLRADAALEAVEKPLDATNVRFAPEVAKHLVGNLLKTPSVSTHGGVLPEAPAATTEEPQTDFIEEEFVEPVQLQVVCFSLYRNLTEETTEITDAHLAAFGDVDEALSEFYQSALKEAAEKAGTEQDKLRRWFEEELITEANTRGLVFRGETETGGIANSAVDALDELHIIRAEVRGRTRWYELSHDRFIQPILRANDAWRSRVQKEENQRREEEKRRLVRRARTFSLLTVALGLLLIVALYAVHYAFQQQVIATIAREHAQRNAQQAERNEATAKANEVIAKQKEAEARIAKGRADRERRLAELRKSEAIAARNEAIVARNDAITAKLAAEAAKTEAENQRNRARENAEIASNLQQQAVAQAHVSSSRALAATSLNRLADDPQLALLLALYSVSQTMQDRSPTGAMQSVSVSRQSLDALLAAMPSSLRQWKRQSHCGASEAASNTAGISTADSSASLAGNENTFPRGIVAVAFAFDDRTVSAVGKSGAPFVWGVSSGRELLVGNCGPIVPAAATLSSDGQLIAAARLNRPLPKDPLAQTIGSRSEVIVTDIRRRSAPSAVLPTHWYQPGALAFSTDDRFLAVAGPWSRRTVYDLNDNHQLWGGFMARLRRLRSRILTYTMGKPPRTVNSVAFAPDGKTLAFGVEDGVVELWGVRSGRPTGLFLRGHSEPVQGLAFSRDGRFLATASRDMTAKIWEIKSKKDAVLVASLLGHNDAVISAAFDPTGNRVATGSQDQTISIWDVHSGRRLIVLPAQGGYVTSVAFSADGKMLASGGSDGSVRIWDVSDLDDVMNVENKIRSFAAAAQFSEDIGSLPKTAVVELLSAAGKHVSRDLSPGECREYFHRSDCPQLISSTR